MIRSFGNEFKERVSRNCIIDNFYYSKFVKNKIFNNCISPEFSIYIKLNVSFLKNLGAAAFIDGCGYIIFLNVPHHCQFWSEICAFLDEEMDLSDSTRKEIYQIIIKNNWNENKTMRIVMEELQPSTLSAKEHELLHGWHLFSSVGEIVLDSMDIGKKGGL